MNLIYSGWCCSDCLFLLANGDTPLELSEEETATWLAEINRRVDGFDITLGLVKEEHTCDYETDRSNGHCNCETQEFSFSQCDVCGSKLGGSRHAVAYFDKKNT